MIITTKLFEFQEKTVNKILELDKKNNYGFELSDTGTGKTLKLLSFMSKSFKQHTLIVCPPFLINNWRNEILKHTNLTPNNINIYYGRNKTLNHNVLINITSYSLLTNECFKNIQRVIFDEAHLLKNCNSERTKKTTKLIEEAKTLESIWFASASLIMNDPKELNSFFRILKITQTNFKYSPHFLSSLKVQDSKNLLMLKNIEDNFIVVPFTDIQQKKAFINTYNAFRNHLYTKNYNMCLIVLNELRQLTSLYVHTDNDNIIKHLKNNNEENMCKICYSDNNDAFYYSSNCLKPHYFCNNCWNKTKNCFVCRTPKNNIICSNKNHEEMLENNTFYHSSKLNTLLEIINKHKNTKIIISTLFLKTFNFLEKNLTNKTIYKISGKVKNKSKVIEDFKNDTNLNAILLVTLTSCAEGFNIIESNVVIHYDLWWNLAKMNQMRDRIYRIGQLNKTYCYYLILQNSIDNFLYDKIIDKNNVCNHYLYSNIKDLKSIKKLNFINDYLDNTCKILQNEIDNSH